MLYYFPHCVLVCKTVSGSTRKDIYTNKTGGDVFRYVKIIGMAKWNAMEKRVANHCDILHFCYILAKPAITLNRNCTCHKIICKKLIKYYLFTELVENVDTGL